MLWNSIAELEPDCNSSIRVTWKKERMKMSAENEIADLFILAAGTDGLRLNEPMKDHTSFRIGGCADYFVIPHNEQELGKCIEICRERELPLFIMGNGSNLLVSDRGFRGVILQIFRSMGEIKAEGTVLEAGAGALLSAVAARAAASGLTGFEFAGGIPGTVGGACFMNAGAYGGEMKDVLTEISVLDRAGEKRMIPASELGMGYRTSAVSREGYIVLGARIGLAAGNREEIASKMEEYKKRRQTKQPLELPSAGSTFKRPEGYFAGKLIMDAGLRGYSVGGAQVSEKHCGFIVNRGGASAEDVKNLIRHIQKTVREHSGVELVPEIRFLGDFQEESGGAG